MPDIELYVKEPYDELLSTALDGSSRADHGEVSVDSPPANLTESQSRWFQNKDQQPYQPAVKPAAEASESPGSVRLKVQFHKPLTMTPQPVLWGEQPVALNEQAAGAERPPSVEGYTELFIEEEDGELQDEEDEDVQVKEENYRLVNERLSPQVEHGVEFEKPVKSLKEH